MPEDYINDYIITGSSGHKQDPTPVDADPNLPYIGKCWDYWSWYACAKKSLSTSGLWDCMLGVLIDNFGQTIINTTPNAGSIPALHNQIDIFWDDMWSNPANGLGYLDQANLCCSPFYGLPYHNGCDSFDLKITQWTNLQSNIPGHVASPPPPIATPPGSNALAASMTSFTNALSGTNQHYKWWRTFYKIRWAQDMKECCDCDLGDPHTTHG
jgi:hypothetical protein